MNTAKTRTAKAKLAAERVARIRRSLQAAGVNAWRESMSLQASLEIVGKAWRQMQELAEGAAEDEAEEAAEAEDKAEADMTAAAQPDRDGIPLGIPSVGEMIGIEAIAAEVMQEIISRTQHP